jgi:hypothetical protein
MLFFISALIITAVVYLWKAQVIPAALFRIQALTYTAYTVLAFSGPVEFQGWMQAGLENRLLVK